MQKNILITAKPKTGKSTLLEKVISHIPNKVGFITKEVRVDDKRTGFEMIAYNGSRAPLADITFETPYQVSKYFVDVNSLDTLIPEVSSFSADDVLYLDEIGQMELFSEKFKSLVLSYLNSPNLVIATISQVYEDEFTKAIKNRDDIVLIELTETNREEKEEYIMSLAEKISS